MRNYRYTYPNVTNSNVTFVEDTTKVSADVMNTSVADIISEMTDKYMDKVEIGEGGASVINGHSGGKRWNLEHKLNEEANGMASSSVKIVAGEGVVVEGDDLTDDVVVKVDTDKVVTLVNYSFVNDDGVLITEDKVQEISGKKTFDKIQINGPATNKKAMLRKGSFKTLADEAFAGVLKNINITSTAGIQIQKAPNGDVSLSVNWNYIKNNIITTQFFERIIKEKVAAEISAHLVNILNTRPSSL